MRIRLEQGGVRQDLLMVFWHVNLWVYAFRKDSPFFEAARAVIQRGIEGNESFLFCPAIASSFLRIVTNPKIFITPSDMDEAWRFTEVLELHPNARFVDVDKMTFGIFKHLSLIQNRRGNEVPDMLLAALAIRYDSVFFTADRAFTNIQGLSVELL